MKRPGVNTFPLYDWTEESDYVLDEDDDELLYNLTGLTKEALDEVDDVKERTVEERLTTFRKTWRDDIVTNYVPLNSALLDVWINELHRYTIIKDWISLTRTCKMFRRKASQLKIPVFNCNSRFLAGLNSVRDDLLFLYHGSHLMINDDPFDYHLSNNLISWPFGHITFSHVTIKSHNFQLLSMLESFPKDRVDITLIINSFNFYSLGEELKINLYDKMWRENLEKTYPHIKFIYQLSPTEENYYKERIGF